MHCLAATLCPLAHHHRILDTTLATHHLMLRAGKPYFYVFGFQCISRTDTLLPLDLLLPRKEGTLFVHFLSEIVPTRSQ